MSRWIPQEYQDLLLNLIAECNQESICSQQPATYFEAVRPPLWLTNTLTAVGAIVHSPTDNNKVYECIIGGTTGSSEPGWGTTQDQVFTDGTVSWKTHNNYTLATRVVDSGDFVITDDVATGGRRLSVSEEMGIITHSAGTVTHTALICSTDKTVRFVTLAQTTIGGSEVESGRTTIFHGFDIIFADPTAE